VACAGAVLVFLLLVRAWTGAGLEGTRPAATASATTHPPPPVARLHAALDALGLQARDAATVAASLRSAARASSQQRQQDAEAGADPALTASFAALLAGLAPPAHCAPGDPSLPPAWGDLSGRESDAAASPPSPVLIAANLRDAAHLLPHWTVQALALASAAPPGRVFVSVYESGSADATPAWLGLAGRLLAAAGVPATLVARGAGEARPPGTPRIAHLAALRNRALAPLLSREAAAAGAAAAAAGGGAGPANASHYLWAGLSEAGYAALGGTPPAAAAGGGEVRRRPGEGQAAPGGFPAARVLFVNDVFFCAADAVRLLLSGAAARAAIACGLDLYPDAPPGAVFGGRRVVGRGSRVRTALARLAPPGRRWASLPSAEVRPHGPRGPTLSDRVVRAHDSLLFYDAWVARDAAGLPFLGGPPFLAHPYSRLRLEAGLPFPASCCWNGMASLDAGPFVHGGYRFRAVAATAEAVASAAQAAGAGVVVAGAAGAAACPASECSLLCEDWTRAGAAPRIIVDPAVRLAYDAGVAADAVGRGGGGGGSRGARGVGLPTVPLLPYGAAAAAPPVDFGFVPRKFSMTCCPAGAGGDEVVHWERCGAGAVLDRGADGAGL
jgi:alpha-1,3-mannosyltransferase